MAFTSELSAFANCIKVAYVAKDLSVKVKVTKLNLALCALFYRYGLIQSFFIKNSHSVVVRLQYHHNSPLLKRFSVISTPGHRVFWSRSQIARTTGRHAVNSLYILSTTKGLRTNHECLATAGPGGEVLFFIQF